MTLPVLDTDQLIDACHEAEKLAAHTTLPFQRQKWQGAAGEMQGMGVGSSIDFHDQRLYAPGDDPRHINWQAFARSGDYQMKLYREEVRPELVLLVDASASMMAYAEKARRVAELLYFTIASARSVGARVQTFFVGSNDFRLIEESNITQHTWIKDFEELSAGSVSVPALGSFILRPKSMRVLISDLLYPADPEEILRTLNYQSAHTLVLAPQALEESDPEWSGNYQFKDPESGKNTPLHIAPDARKRYLTAYQAHFSHWQRSCVRHRTDFLRVPSELPLDHLAGQF